MVVYCIPINIYPTLVVYYIPIYTSTNIYQYIPIYAIIHHNIYIYTYILRNDIYLPNINIQPPCFFVFPHDYHGEVLTLNVELDGGLARPGKISTWWRQFRQIRCHRATVPGRSRNIIQNLDMRHMFDDIRVICNRNIKYQISNIIIYHLYIYIRIICLMIAYCNDYFV